MGITILCHNDELIHAGIEYGTRMGLEGVMLPPTCCAGLVDDNECTVHVSAFRMRHSVYTLILEARPSVMRSPTERNYVWVCVWGGAGTSKQSVSRFSASYTHIGHKHTRSKEGTAAPMSWFCLPFNMPEGVVDKKPSAPFGFGKVAD